jgi:hypothetical protein
LLGVELSLSPDGESFDMSLRFQRAQSSEDGALTLPAFVSDGLDFQEAVASAVHVLGNGFEHGTLSDG